MLFLDAAGTLGFVAQDGRLYPFLLDLTPFLGAAGTEERAAQDGRDPQDRRSQQEEVNKPVEQCTPQREAVNKHLEVAYTEREAVNMLISETSFQCDTAEGRTQERR